MRGVAGWLLCVGLMLSACSGQEGSAPPEASSSPATPPRELRSSADPIESEPRAREPLALVVAATRPVADVSLAAARRLIRTGDSSLPALGQRGGEPLQAVYGGVPKSAFDGFPVGVGGVKSARAALREVRRDPGVLAMVPASTLDPRVRVLTVGGVSPLRQPGRYPLQVATGNEPGTVVTATLVGDVMLGRAVGDHLQRVGDPAAVLRPMARRLASADITVGNFESTLSDDGVPTQGTDSFAADPSVLRGLKLAGFDAVSLANNHVGDYGDAALRTTLKRFDAAGIGRFGAGRDLAEARRPYVVEIRGVRTGFLATDSIGETPAATGDSSGTNRLDMPPRTGPLDRSALRRVAGDVRRLAGRVDTVIVMPHWGTQYTYVPEPSQHRVARVLARAGADLVVGGHPHWVQGWEQVDDTAVVHSLGNFVFDMDFSRETQEGVLLEVVTWDGRVMATEPVPYVIGSDFAPRVAGPARADAILDPVWATSRGPYRAR
jgi:poly-gamma-glutamate synthesis protein (capsule biosynthesis protein)